MKQQQKTIFLKDNIIAKMLKCFIILVSLKNDNSYTYSIKQNILTSFVSVLTLFQGCGIRIRILTNQNESSILRFLFVRNESTKQIFQKQIHKRIHDTNL
jgi:hypothetical protein